MDGVALETELLGHSVGIGGDDLDALLGGGEALELLRQLLHVQGQLEGAGGESLEISRPEREMEVFDVRGIHPGDLHPKFGDRALEDGGELA